MHENGTVKLTYDNYKPLFLLNFIDRDAYMKRMAEPESRPLIADFLWRVKMPRLASSGAAALAAVLFAASVGVAAAKDARQPRARDYYGAQEQVQPTAGPDWKVGPSSPQLAKPMVVEGV